MPRSEAHPGGADAGHHDGERERFAAAAAGDRAQDHGQDKPADRYDQHHQEQRAAKHKGHSRQGRLPREQRHEQEEHDDREILKE